MSASDDENARLVADARAVNWPSRRSAPRCQQCGGRPQRRQRLITAAHFFCAKLSPAPVGAFFRADANHPGRVAGRSFVPPVDARTCIPDIALCVVLSGADVVLPMDLG
jgi:hypothetical protein